MNRVIAERTDELRTICERHRVARLDVFGSAAGEDFDPGSSDVDLIVEFEKLPPADHADCYFGLLIALEQLFGTTVDLLEAAPITNPYLLDSIERTRVRVYEAA